MSAYILALEEATVSTICDLGRLLTDCIFNAVTKIGIKIQI